MLSKKYKTVILNGNLFIKNKFLKGSVFINYDKIEKVVPGETDAGKIRGYKIIHAKDSFVSYGFFDPHVHFRTPGFEYKEDWDTGSRAALHGGFTYVLDMPNTKPAGIDEVSLIEKNKLTQNSIINHGFYLGLTDENAKDVKNIFKSLENKGIKLLGVKIFLGSSTGDLLIKKDESLKASLSSGLINLFHCEDEAVLEKYNTLPYNSIYGHEKKRPAEAEVSAFQKIISSISKQSKIYICHVSSKELVYEIEKARQKGYKIISEITPHHLFFNTENIKDSNIYKVNPPIRKKEDTDELKRYFNAGFFDIIGTDHAPHKLTEKESTNPPSGFPGVESAFYALYALYEKGEIKLENIFKLMSSGYKIFDIKKRGEIKKGNFADLTIIKKEANLFTHKNCFSKADFSPFDGLRTNAKISTVILRGEVVLDNGKLLL